MPTVALIDYGSGNLRSAEKALARAAGTLRDGPEIVVTDSPDAIARADLIVLPDEPYRFSASDARGWAGSRARCGGSNWAVAR